MLAPTTPHIVAIDHAPDIRALLHDILECHGYRVTTCCAVADDLTELFALAPDLIMLDFTAMTMVEDWSLLLRLALDRRTATIPVVLCTAAVHEVEALGERLAELCVAVVAKPFEPEAVLGAVRAGLAHRTP